MAGLTPAQEYGAFLGAFQRNLQRFWKQVAEGFKLGLTPPEMLSPEDLEKRQELQRERAFQRRIEAERQIGLRFVRKEVRRAREELGLDDHNHTNV